MLSDDIMRTNAARVERFNNRGKTMTQTVTLEPEEWQRVLAIIGTKEVWVVANPLLQKIGSQLERQQSGNSKMQEVPVPQPHLESKSTN